MMPLSEKMRPKDLSQIFGQKESVRMIEKIILSKKPLSLLFFGPPGSGKTTLAKIYATSFSLPFRSLSAVFNTASELKKILKEGNENPLLCRQMLVFVDEIHRFNRMQQDIFLPFLEDGSLVLIGATTENPSFALNNALLSRLRVVKLETLDPESLDGILNRYELENSSLSLDAGSRKNLIEISAGDARHLLNMVENLKRGLPLQRRAALYDKQQEGHYNLISALHKSVRGSDPDAALYWFCRMLEAGEDPKFIGRRLIRMATEDIGLADPQALGIALNGWNTYHMLGSPEGELALAEVVLYLALSPKSNAVYTAYGAAKKMASETGHLDPPQQILNAPTRLMKEMGYAEGYIYDPDTPHGFSAQNYFPDQCERPCFYHPVQRGFEREMKKRVDYFKRLRELLHQSSS